ncbi:MAG: glycoside hydrolase family 18 protein [Bacteroidota bacterium]|nr:glycoside hydrolase family 18 protein [Bacteroidota bacterium]
MKIGVVTLGFFFLSLVRPSFAQQKQLTVFGYFAGRPTMIDSFPVEKLTHLCYSFTHLKGSRISLNNARDSATLRNCVAQKKRNPALKVIVSLGGWTGCYTCSEIFSKDSSVRIFASSVKKLLNDFHADGIDLDWEYPVIEGPPGHPFSAADKNNFTQLIKVLRDSIGYQKELSFAAGGFRSYLASSIDWTAILPYVDRINLMTYDLVGGYDTVTGHHTALYSTKTQKESCDAAVSYLVNRGVPVGKLVLGAAFYARIWQNVPAAQNGLYQKGKFLRGVSFRNFDSSFSKDSGFVYHWDKKAHAPYLYNAQKQWFVTFDDSRSITDKMKYVKENGLDGIMFWQLADDRFSDGLLDLIDRLKRGR